MIDSKAPFSATAVDDSARTVTRTPLRLLLVDDHANTLQALSHILKRDGHTVVSATTVKEALAAAAANTFDLIISDLGLPDGSGVDLMKQLRAKHQLQGIALTGYGAEEDVVRTREAGFTTHLTKPVSVVALRRAIASFTPIPR